MIRGVSQPRDCLGGQPARDVVEIGLIFLPHAVYP